MKRAINFHLAGINHQLITFNAPISPQFILVKIRRWGVIIHPVTSNFWQTSHPYEAVGWYWYVFGITGDDIVHCVDLNALLLKERNRGGGQATLLGSL